MPQLQITTTTLARMKTIVGANKVRDGDYLVNEMIDIFEKKISDLRQIILDSYQPTKNHNLFTHSLHFISEWIGEWLEYTKIVTDSSQDKIMKDEEFLGILNSATECNVIQNKSPTFYGDSN